MIAYIVQDSGGKNFSSLYELTDNVVVVASRDFPLFDNADDHVEKICQMLKHFDIKNDCLVLAGDPVNIGVAVHEIMKKGGGKILKWDRQTNLYVPIMLKENRYGKKTSEEKTNEEKTND